MVTVAAHVAIAVVVLAQARPAVPPVSDPVVLVELPAESAPAASIAATQQIAQPQPQPQPAFPQPTTPLVPPVHAPLPQDAVTLPAAAPPQPVRQIAAPVFVPTAASSAVVSTVGTGSGTSPTPGFDPKAKRQESDYFALVSAHLNRRKTYPIEARQAREEGVVTVRFTVARDGSVSAASIKRSSGHAVLDEATLQLLQRVAPLPRMPSSMQRDSVTLALPIQYSLKTS
jgi:protein TonB